MCPCQNENFGHAGINAEMKMSHKYYEDSKCLVEAVVTLMKDPHEYGS